MLNIQRIAFKSHRRLFLKLKNKIPSPFSICIISTLHQKRPHSSQPSTTNANSTHIQHQPPQKPFDPENNKLIFENMKTITLLKSWALFNICSSKYMVNIMIKVMNNFYKEYNNQSPNTKPNSKQYPLKSEPGFSSFTTQLLNIPKRLISMSFFWIIRNQFFPLFTGGETIEECIKKCDIYLESGIRVIIDNSTEEAINEPTFNRNLIAKKHLLDISHKFLKESVVFLPIKITSLCSPIMLENMTRIINDENPHEWNPRPFMSDCEIKELDIALDRILQLINHAKKYNIRVFIDAEQYVRQSGLNYMSRELQSKVNIICNNNYNETQVTVFNTYQCYLRSAQEWIEYDIEYAAKNNFAIGLKLVRGAYLEGEIALALKENRRIPLHPNITTTHMVYNDMVSKVLEKVSDTSVNIGVAVCTHNRESIQLATNIMNDLGIVRDHKNVFFGQLEGMCDNLTFALGVSGYNSLKLIPYGEFDDVWPYLMRRLLENQSIFGGTSKEKGVYGKELRRRFSPF